MNSKYKEIEDLLYNYKVIKVGINNSRLVIENLELKDELEGTDSRNMIKRVESKIVLNANKLSEINIILEGLTEIEREIINLYYFDGYSWDEVSGKIGYSKRWVSGKRKQILNKILEMQTI